MPTILQTIKSLFLENKFSTSTTVNRLPSPGLYFCTEKEKPSILSDLSFSTHFNSKSIPDSKIFQHNNVTFVKQKYSSCAGHKFCRDCKKEYSNNHKYCSTLVELNGEWRICGKELTQGAKCEGKMNWLHDEAKQNHAILFRDEHNHGKLITTSPTKAFEEAVKEMIIRNPQTTARDVRKRKSLTNDDNMVIYNDEALGRLIRKIKNKLFGDNSIANVPAKIDDIIDEFLKSKDESKKILNKHSLRDCVGNYLRDFVISDIPNKDQYFSLALPIQSLIAGMSKSPFNIDSAYDKKTGHGLYHFNIATWCDQLGESVVVFRGRIESLSTESHLNAFRSFFGILKQDIQFNLKNWLSQTGTGFTVDFSLAQLNGLRRAILEELISLGVNESEARNIIQQKIQGCQFHYYQNLNKMLHKSGLQKTDRHRQQVHVYLKTAAQCQSVKEADDMLNKAVEFDSGKMGDLLTFVDWWRERLNILISKPGLKQLTNNIAESLNAQLRKHLQSSHIIIEVKNCYEKDASLFEKLEARQNGIPTSFRINPTTHLKKKNLKKKKNRYVNDGIATENTIDTGDYGDYGVDDEMDVDYNPEDSQELEEVGGDEFGNIEQVEESNTSPTQDLTRIQPKQQPTRKTNKSESKHKKRKHTLKAASNKKRKIIETEEETEESEESDGSSSESSSGAEIVFTDDSEYTSDEGGIISDRDYITRSNSVLGSQGSYSKQLGAAKKQGRKDGRKGD